MNRASNTSRDTKGFLVFVVDVVSMILQPDRVPTTEGTAKGRMEEIYGRTTGND
jgi:hypothetical protein